MWGNDAVALPCRHQPWSGVVVDMTCIETLCLISSIKSGSGKTRWIRQELASMASRGMETGTITIHERSTASTLTRDLAANFSHRDCERALHLSFSYAPTDSSVDCEWFQAMNSFFFDILVLRVVRDPQLRRSYYLGSGTWKLFVELPEIDIAGKAWLQRYIPVLATWCEEKSPPNQFEIDSKTRRVCLYLRAYKDGTINRKFEPATHRRLVFVLDRSGSMGCDVGGGKSAFAAAVDCALEIFDSHVHCGDVSCTCSSVNASFIPHVYPLVAP